MALNHSRRTNPIAVAITFGMVGCLVLGRLVANSLGLETDPLIDGPQYDFEEIWGCVMLPMLGVGGAVMFALLNRYGRGDDDTDLTDFYRD